MSRIPSLCLGALWMRAVANACGYTPMTAKPLGLAYAHARVHRLELEDGNLDFAGLSFVEPREGHVLAGLELFRPTSYDRDVVGGFCNPADHHRIFYDAADRAELFPIERLDQTAVAWRRLQTELGARRSVSLAEAGRIVGRMTP